MALVLVSNLVWAYNDENVSITGEVDGNAAAVVVKRGKLRLAVEAYEKNPKKNEAAFKKVLAQELAAGKLERRLIKGPDTIEVEV